MPLSLSHIQFMRRLSIQPEEDTDMDDDPNPADVTSRIGNGYINDPNDYPLSPCTKNGKVNSEHSQDGDYESRKLSIISIKSTSSLSSTCSAPGGISTSLGHGMSYSSSVPFSNLSELYDMKPSTTKQQMTSRPSFISLCSIVSETSETSRKLLPAPLQVELDLLHRSGLEGDEPKCRSHLGLLKCQSDYDINELDLGSDECGQLYLKNSKKGLVKGIKDFPKRMRKMSTEKNRFDVYSISDETRDQLKRLYVY